MHSLTDEKAELGELEAWPKVTGGGVTAAGSSDSGDLRAGPRTTYLAILSPGLVMSVLRNRPLWVLIRPEYRLPVGSPLFNSVSSEPLAMDLQQGRCSIHVC